MTLQDVERVLAAARANCGWADYVVIGSLCTLGASVAPPARMASSVDLDLYPRDDPGAATAAVAGIGEDSDFHRAFDCYADAVSPLLPVLPDGWQDRLVPVHFASGVTAWFLELHDAAVSKYARGEDRDRQWASAGLAAGLLDPDLLETRLWAALMEPDERQRAMAAFRADVAELRPPPD